MTQEYDGKTIIGRYSEVDLLVDGVMKVPAKIDTGADASAIWASELEMNDAGELSFCLFGKSSPFYSGKRHSTKSFDVSAIRSAHGTLQVRYRVQLVIRMAGRRIKGTFTLAERSKNSYPILIGSRLLNGKFLVDVSKGHHAKSGILSEQLNKELQRDPKGFFQKYHADNQGGDFEL